MRQRLILTAPAGLSAVRLSAALEAGDVAAVVIAPGDGAAALVRAAQEAGAAALVAQDTWPAPYGADGLHLPADGVSPLKARPEGSVCGAVAGDRHTAMMAGEAGADYVWFEGAGDETACALASWWQATFEVPAVVAGPAASLAAMIVSRAEFVAMVDVFDGQVDAVALVAAANAALDAAQEDA
ncbi:MAG: thiamine phosphate synthase [Pseudomonadota bacterium]